LGGYATFQKEDFITLEEFDHKSTTVAIPALTSAKERSDTMVGGPNEQNQGQRQGQLTEDQQRDLDKANALRKSLENDAAPQAGNLTEGVLTNGGQMTVAGTINSEDLATFIKDVFAAQSKIDAEKMTARLTEARGALQREEGGARVFEASDVYKRLQDYGLVIDPDVFRWRFHF
jgi:hypothetical protein